jgi:hypothetical protein
MEAKVTSTLTEFYKIDLNQKVPEIRTIIYVTAIFFTAIIYVFNFIYVIEF